METKICIICKNKKDINDFHRRKDSIDGHRNDCKECRHKIELNYRKNKNPESYFLLEERERLVKEGKKRCTKCKNVKLLEDFPQDKNKFKGRGERCNECRMDQHYVESYGINKRDFETLVKNQNFKCKICFQEIKIGHDYEKGVRFANLDHNHKTGKIRGILCNKCNQALGLLEEDPIIIERALKYIQNV